MNHSTLRVLVRRQRDEIGDYYEAVCIDAFYVSYGDAHKEAFANLRYVLADVMEVAREGDGIARFEPAPLRFALLWWLARCGVLRGARAHRWAIPCQ